MSTETIVSPENIFNTLWGFQRTAALKTGIDLDVFTAIAEGDRTAAALARKSGASERGMRILCDYLTIIGLLGKSGASYELTPESAMFLNRQSPAYLGTIASFLTIPEIVNNFADLTSTVRRGGVAEKGNTVAEENPIWIEFARAMVPMAMPSAFAIADLLSIASAEPVQVLDIAAGHGMFGIVLAERNPKVSVVAVDWAPVLAVAEEHRALKPGGRIVVLEFVPNPDRVSPPMAAAFSLTMLAGTHAGDAYTLAELQRQLEGAGFKDVTAHPLPSPQTVLVARK
jgi:hypothetical protein